MSTTSRVLRRYRRRMTRLEHLRGPVGDGIAFVVCVGAMCIELAVGNFEVGPTAPLPVALLGYVVASLPVFLRRYRPVTSFVLAMVLLLAVLTTSSIYQTLALPAMLCGYSLADRRGRDTATWWAAALTAPAVLLILHVFSPHSLLGWDTVKNLAFIALPLALGVAAHDRRAYTAALVARAEDAERSREEEALRRVGEERLRIARDVHDVVAHAMVAINVQAGVGAHLLDRDLEQARETLRNIKAVSGSALTDLRSMLGVLRPGADESAPVHPTQGLDALDDLRAGLGSAGVDLELDVDEHAIGLPASIGTAGYRIVQEALTNVMRHAGPTTATVRVRCAEDTVVIDVEDDGGASPAPLGSTGAGYGVRGMKERAGAVGGSLEAGPRDGGGWRVHAILPMRTEAVPVAATSSTASSTSVQPIGPAQPVGTS